MAAIPTYILSPNFTFVAEPEDSWLGNIIADPLNPRGVLSSETVPEASILTVPEDENSYTNSASKSVAGRLWARFCQVASVDAELSASASRSTTYTMTRLETQYLRHDPTDEEVTMRVKSSPQVQAAIRSGVFEWAPVYMITGLKIARGLRVNKSSSGEVAGHVGAEATVTPDSSVTVGGQVGGSRGRGSEQSFKSTTDIIFAYQLHAVTTKGWREKRHEIGLYKSRAAFLELQASAPAETEVTMEATKATSVDYEAFLADEILEETIKVETVGNGIPDEDQFCCVILKKDL